MRFVEGNSIVFYQDHGWWLGVPSDVDFEIDKMEADGMVLRAPGFGAKGAYGNGAIHVAFRTSPKKEITEAQLQEAVRRMNNEQLGEALRQQITVR